MPQAWRETLTAGLAGAGGGGRALLAYWSRPAQLRRLQLAFLLLLLAWLGVSLARIAWSLLPAPDVAMPPAADLVNPAREAAPETAAPAVDIEEAMGWHLFGEAGAATAEALAELERQQEAARARQGIEDGARETRLALTLRGIVSSDDEGFGYAMIEHGGRQQLYAVGDELPAGRRVLLAKVLPRRVVIDNAGTYELLSLFEESEFDRQLASQPRRAAVRDQPAAEAPGRARASARPGAGSAGLAAQYRDRLYNDPESLAEVVRVSAVREGDALLGYRVSPGRAAEDFEALGFEPGDIVTGINGLPLDDPGNTVRLYQAMREAREAVFDLQRDGQALSLSVRLSAAGDTD